MADEEDELGIFNRLAGSLLHCVAVGLEIVDQAVEQLKVDARLVANLPPVSNELLFGMVVQRHVIERLLASERLRGRMTDLIRSVCGELPQQLDHDAHVACSSTSSSLLSVVRKAGCACYARTIVGIIDGQAARAIAAAVGADAYKTARAIGHVAPDLSIDPSIDLSRLPEMADVAGLRCMRAWLNRQPLEVRTRIEMLHPPVRGVDVLEDPKAVSVFKAVLLHD